MMERTVRKLMIAFWGLIGAALVVVAVFEFNVLSTGILSGDNSLEFLSTSLMELLAVVCIPLALKLFRIGRVAAKLSADGGARSLSEWGLLRILLLGGPMFVNTLLYYLFMKATFGYTAIIFLISMLFIYPSRIRCLYETKRHDTE